jgi:hypothetical protein
MNRKDTCIGDCTVCFGDCTDNSIRALHSAFGGELWFEDVLCFKDGKEILQPFVRAPYGQWQLSWFREDDDWRLLKGLDYFSMPVLFPRTPKINHLPPLIRPYIRLPTLPRRDARISYPSAPALFTNFRNPQASA